VLDNDCDAPTVLVYERRPYRYDYDGAQLDDDCGSDDDLYAGWPWDDCDTNVRSLLFDPLAGFDCADDLDATAFPADDDFPF